SYLTFARRRHVSCRSLLSMQLLGAATAAPRRCVACEAGVQVNGGSVRWTKQQRIIMTAWLLAITMFRDSFYQISLIRRRRSTRSRGFGLPICLPAIRESARRRISGGREIFSPDRAVLLIGSDASKNTSPGKSKVLQPRLYAVSAISLSANLKRFRLSSVATCRGLLRAVSR